jgi:hypothetical protein
MEATQQLPEIEVLFVNSIDELAARLPHHHTYFTLLLAWDAPEISQSELIKIFRPLVDIGMAYFCSWGKGCEEVHDAVDLADLEREREFGESDYFQMTTWHKNDTLADAMWFFVNCAIPAEDHVVAGWDRFAVSIGDHNWIAEMKRALVTIQADLDDQDD